MRARRLVAHCMREGLPELLRKKIIRARKRADKLTHKIEREIVVNDEELFRVEEMLLRSYLLHVFSGFKQRYLMTYLAPLNAPTLVETGTCWQFARASIVVLILLIILGATSGYTILQGQGLGTIAAKHWLYCVTICLALDWLFVQPTDVFFRTILIPELVRPRLLATWQALADRASFIMTRTRGQLTHVHGLVHHLNPACRAARHFPRLPAARLLLSLNDFDLLVREDYLLDDDDLSGHIAEKLRAAAALCFGMFFLPANLRLTDVLVQFYSTIILYNFFMIFYSGSGSDTTILLGVMVLMLITIPILSIIAAQAAEDEASKAVAKQAAEEEEENRNRAMTAMGGKKSRVAASGKLIYEGMQDDYYVPPVEGPPMMSPLKPVVHHHDTHIGAPQAAAGVLYAGSLQDAQNQNAALLESLGLARSALRNGTESMTAGMTYAGAEPGQQYGYTSYSPPARAIHRAEHEGAPIGNRREDTNIAQLQDGDTDVEVGLEGTANMSSPVKFVSKSRRTRTTRMRVMEMLGIGSGAKMHAELPDQETESAKEEPTESRVPPNKYQLGIGRGMNAIDVSAELYKSPREPWEEAAARSPKNLFVHAPPLDNIRLSVPRPSTRQEGAMVMGPPIYLSRHSVDEQGRRDRYLNVMQKSTNRDKDDKPPLWS